MSSWNGKNYVKMMQMEREIWQYAKNSIKKGVKKWIIYKKYQTDIIKTYKIYKSKRERCV